MIYYIVTYYYIINEKNHYSLDAYRNCDLRVYVYYFINKKLLFFINGFRLQLFIIGTYVIIDFMIQVITSVSEKIYSYVTLESTEEVNNLFLEFNNKGIQNLLTDKIEKMITANLYSLPNNRVVKLCLNYESLDYAKTLAYKYKVNIIFIYECAYLLVNNI